MTKKFKNVFLAGFIFNIFFHKVYAASIDITLDKALLIGSIILGLQINLSIWRKYETLSIIFLRLKHRITLPPSSNRLTNQNWQSSRALKSWKHLRKL